MSLGQKAVCSDGMVVKHFLVALDEWSKEKEHSSSSGIAAEPPPRSDRARNDVFKSNCASNIHPVEASLKFSVHDIGYAPHTAPCAKSGSCDHGSSILNATGE